MNADQTDQCPSLGPERESLPGNKGLKWARRCQEKRLGECRRWESDQARPSEAMGCWARLCSQTCWQWSWVIRGGADRSTHASCQCLVS